MGETTDKVERRTVRFRVYTVMNLFIENRDINGC